MKVFARKLTSYYYICLLLVVLFAVLGYYLNRQGIAVGESLFVDLQSALVLYVLATVPLSLWYFNKRVKALRPLSDEAEKCRKYASYVRLNIAVIASGVYLSLLGYYLLPKFEMIYLAGMGAIVLVFFCRPTQQRVENDLADEQPVETVEDNAEEADKDFEDEAISDETAASDQYDDQVSGEASTSEETPKA